MVSNSSVHALNILDYLKRRQTYMKYSSYPYRSEKLFRIRKLSQIISNSELRNEIFLGYIESFNLLFSYSYNSLFTNELNFSSTSNSITIIFRIIRNNSVIMLRKFEIKCNVNIESSLISFVTCMNRYLLITITENFYDDNNFNIKHSYIFKFIGLEMIKIMEITWTASKSFTDDFIYSDGNRIVLKGIENIFVLSDALLPRHLNQDLLNIYEANNTDRSNDLSYLYTYNKKSKIPFYMYKLDIWKIVQFINIKIDPVERIVDYEFDDIHLINNFLIVNFKIISEISPITSKNSSFYMIDLNLQSGLIRSKAIKPNINRFIPKIMDSTLFKQSNLSFLVGQSKNLLTDSFNIIGFILN